nr:uncharacterized protein LOC127330085 [Lolium perenne]
MSPPARRRRRPGPSTPACRRRRPARPLPCTLAPPASTLRAPEPPLCTLALHAGAAALPDASETPPPQHLPFVAKSTAPARPCRQIDGFLECVWVYPLVHCVRAREDAESFPNIPGWPAWRITQHRR